MSERSKEWLEGYEVGYREGGSSPYADWIMSLEEEFGIENITGPVDFIEKTNRQVTRS